MSSASKRRLETADSSQETKRLMVESEKTKPVIMHKGPAPLKLDAQGLYQVDPGRNEWWKRTVVYEVYVRSFFDSNGDGIGDLQGIESKLDYFVDLGVETLWLTPFYTSPMKDFGYDISNFVDVDPIFGSLEDFKSLLKSMKSKGLKLIMDFVPNHTSDKHSWFIKSCQKIEPYTDYYIWKPAITPEKEELESKTAGTANRKPPNNWVSVFGGSMWEWNEERGEYYLHQFTKEQPDLNFRNPQVVQEIKNVMEFWLELGVDGFRLDAVAHIFENARFLDESPSTTVQKLEVGQSSESKPLPNEYGYWDHPYTSNLPEVLDLLATFRSIFDKFSERDGHSRIMMTEAYLPIQELIKYYGTMESPIADFPFNFDIISNLPARFNARKVYDIVNSWMNTLPKGKWPNWLTGNHDVMRMSTKWGSEMVDLLHMIILLLPGTAISYYGEEIGMENTELTWQETQDPAGLNVGQNKFKQFSRDPQRTPMQWNQSTNAGFSTGDKVWLPVNPNFDRINVEIQSKTSQSHLTIYKKLVCGRKLEAFLSGHLEIQVLNDNQVFAFTRVSPLSTTGILVVINFGDKSTKVNTSSFLFNSTKLTIYVRSSPNLSLHTLDSFEGDDQDDQVDSNSIFLPPRAGIVFTFTPTTPVTRE